MSANPKPIPNRYLPEPHIERVALNHAEPCREITPAQEWGMREIMRDRDRLILEREELLGRVAALAKRVGEYEREGHRLRQRLAPQEGSPAERALQLAGHLRESCESLGDVVGVNDETVGHFLAEDAQSIADSIVDIERENKNYRYLRARASTQLLESRTWMKNAIEALRGAAEDAGWPKCDNCDGTGGEPYEVDSSSRSYYPDDPGYFVNYYDADDRPCDECMGAGRMPS